MVGVVKGDDVQLFDSELAVFVERALVHADVHNLAGQESCLLVVAHELALERERELVDHRRVHMLALRHVEARARHLVGHAVAGLDAHIVTGRRMLCVAHAQVNAPRFKMFFTVLWPPLKYIAIMSTGRG